MKSNNILLLLFMLIGWGVKAQTVSITVTDDGQPMAYHTITVSHGDYVLGTGRTDSRGFVSIHVPNLRSKSIDVAGKYKNGGTKREWSIKGKLKLDRSNNIHIRLEKIGEDIEKSRKKMEQRRKAMSDKMDKHFKRSKSFFDEEEDDFFNKDDDDDTPKSNTSFEAGLTKIKNTHSSFDKKDIALDIIKSNELTTKQIKELMDQFHNSFSKKEVAIAAYSNCIDKKNYERVIKTLTSEFMQKDVRKATIGQ